MLEMHIASVYPNHRTYRYGSKHKAAQDVTRIMIAKINT